MFRKSLLIAAGLFILFVTNRSLLYAQDCNGNGIDDACDIYCGNANGPCDLPGCGSSLDCNSNGIPDDCDLAAEFVAELTPDTPSLGTRFGHSAAISGDNIIIGAYWDEAVGGQSTGGSAYIFHRLNGVWERLALLQSDDPEVGNWFGSSVTIDGDTAIIGASEFNSNGSAYVFRKIGNDWEQIAKLTASDGNTFDYFGHSVALSGDTAIVGAYGNDDDGVTSGSAYVFREIGGTWQQIAKLTANDADEGDLFGYSVAIHNGTAIISSHFDDDFGSASGSAYVFREVSGTWQQITKINPNDASAGNLFGNSISVCGSDVIIGAYNDDNADSVRVGAAYVFREVEGNWQQIIKLTPDDGARFGRFGFTVGISGTNIIVGASQGSAYMFREIAGTWTQLSKHSIPNAGILDDFGFSVALDGDTAIAGVSMAESAYLFDLTGDCNRNGVPDECDIADNVSIDCDNNGTPDECESDIDGDAVIDACDICPGFDDSVDIDVDGLPDGCDACPLIPSGQMNGQMPLDFDDLPIFVAALLDPASVADDVRCNADVNLDGRVNGSDIQAFVNMVLVP